MRQIYRHAEWLAALAALMAPVATANWACADEGLRFPSSKAPFAEAVVDSDAQFKAGKATAWSDQAAQFLLLEHDVTLEVGSYGFRARRTLVRIDTERHPGRVIRHLSMYMDDAKPLRGKGQVTAQAQWLLVTVSTTGVMNLSADLLERVDGPPHDALVDAAADRIRRYHTALLRPVGQVPDGPPLIDPQAEATRQTRRQNVQDDLAQRRHAPTANDPVTEQPLSPEPAAPPRPHASTADNLATDKPPTPEPAAPQHHTEGVFIPDWENFQYRPTDDGGMLVLYGGASITYANYEDNISITLSCQNAVIFFDRQAEYTAGSLLIKEADVRGIYLEDNVVVTNGRYTVRSPRAYYDPALQKAIVLEAVFFTWDVKRQIPLYVRAERLRQESQRSWSAQRGLFTTSEFAEPHFSIAAEQLTVEMRDRPDGETFPHVTAQKISPKIGEATIVSLGRFEADITSIPLRRAEGRHDGNLGPIVKTRWAAYGLLGQEAPPGVDLKANIDYVGDHGPAIGLDLDYEKPDLYGSMESYLVGIDDGKDEIGGRKIDHSDETRGFARWQHRQDLGSDLKLSLELGYVSDNTFLEEFERSEAEESKPYETSMYLKYQREDELLDLLGQYDLMNFTPQTTTLQSPGYTVEKMPELGYYRIGANLLDNRLTYYTENRMTRMRIRVGHDSPMDRGFSMAESLATFVLPNTAKFDDVATATGIPQSYIGRLDSRHELQAPLNMGDIDIVPYVVGRATLYDQDFENYVGEGDDSRLWGMVGARLHTSISKIYTNVENQVLDLHRLRHIIEPSMDLFFAHSTLDSDELPVFDPDVEAISEGSGLRLGVRNTLQTQRGGPGRWRNVDWLVVNTDVILRSDDSDSDRDDDPNPNVFGNAATEPARYFSYRPEFSRGRDHMYADLAWMLSDTFAIVADATHSLENSQLAQLHAGVVITHTPLLNSFIEYEGVDVLDSRLLSLGFTYQLTTKYRVGLTQKWDIDRDESRRTDLVLERKLPRWTLLVMASIDDIDENASLGFVLIPDGIKTSRRLGPLGR